MGSIIRNASRIFSLIGDNGRAIKLLKGSEYYKYDPQILSAEIAFSQLENRKTAGVEIANKLIFNEQYANFEKSELASTLATIEYFRGEYKKSERLFDLSLLAPNKNSFAQSLWYKKDHLLPQNYAPFLDSNEIQTHRYSKENNFVKSLGYALKWKDDEPYSLRPYRVASHISGVLLGKYEEAFNLIKHGMEAQKEIKGENYSTKDELAFNNDLAYYLLKADKVEEAGEYLSPSLSILNKTTKLENYEYVIIATLGLLAYKQGQEDLGKKLYRKTIKFFASTNQPYNAGSAFLNFFDEEIKAISDLESLASLRKELDDFVPDDSQNDLLWRKNNSLQLFEFRLSKAK